MSPHLTVPSITSLPSKPPSNQPVRFLANEISISVSSPARVGTSGPPMAPSSSAQTEGQASPNTDSDRLTSLMTRERGVAVNPIAPRTPSLETLTTRLQRQIIRRLFTSWRWHARQRHWKKLAHAKDEQIMFLLSRLEESQSRGIAYCHRQRGRRLLAAWRAFVDRCKAKRQIEFNAVEFSREKLKSRALQAWRDATKLAILGRQAAQHRTTVVLKAALTAWTIHANAVARMVHNASLRQMHVALAAWKYAARLEASTARATLLAATRRTRLLSQLFDRWRLEAVRSKHLQSMEQQICIDRNTNLLDRVLRSWHAAMHDRIACRLLEQGVFAIETIRSLLTDNRRLAKLVDASLSVSEQVSDLKAASDVNEKLIRKVLALVERPSAAHTIKRTGFDDCPEVFRRLASGKKPGRRAVEEPVEGAQNPKIKAVKAAMADRDPPTGLIDLGRAFESDREPAWPPLGLLVTSVIAVEDEEFFSLANQVNAVFVEEFGWKSSKE